MLSRAPFWLWWELLFEPLAAWLPLRTRCRSHQGEGRSQLTQEKNYVPLTTWLTDAPVLSTKAVLQDALRSAFEATEANNSSDRLRWATAFAHECARLSQEEQPSSVYPGSCPRVRITVKPTAEIQCTDGTRPRCQCIVFFAE